MKILVFLSFILLFQSVQPTVEYSLAEQDLLTPSEVTQNVPLSPTRKTITKFLKEQPTSLVFHHVSPERLPYQEGFSSQLFIYLSQHAQSTPLLLEYSIPPPSFIA
jgi:hypothetical protein